MKFNQEKKILFIDSDIREHYVVEQMLTKDIDIKMVGSVNDAINYYREHGDDLSLIILCVDNISHVSLINSLYEINKAGTKKIVLTTNEMNSEYMHQLLTVYGALDYLNKPYTKKNLDESINDSTKKEYPFSLRLHDDLNLFNQFIAQSNQQSKSFKIESIGLTTLDDQVNILKDSMSIIAKELNMPSLPKGKRPNILCVDDEEQMLDIYKGFLVGKPFNVQFSKNLANSKLILDSNNIDIIVLDLGLPDGHGVNLLDRLYKTNPTDINKPDVIVVSSYYEKNTVVKVIRSGARVYINKPMSSKKFISTLYQIIFLRYARHYFKANYSIARNQKETFKDSLKIGGLN